MAIISFPQNSYIRYIQEILGNDFYNNLLNETKVSELDLVNQRYFLGFFNNELLFVNEKEDLEAIFKFNQKGSLLDKRVKISCCDWDFKKERTALQLNGNRKVTSYLDNILKISEQHFFDYRAENPELGVERFGPDFGLKLTEFGYNDPRQCFKRYCFGEGADIVLDYSMKRANSMGQWTCFGTPCKITNKKL